MKSFVLGRFKAFKYVFRGMFWMLKHEASFQVQTVLLFMSLMIARFLKFDFFEWIIIIVLWGIIFTAETFNTSVEKLSDVVSPDFNEKIRDVKDISAGAVGWVALTGAVVFFLLILRRI